LLIKWDGNPEFFALYDNARNVVNTAARKRKGKQDAADENQQIES
jgi:hypothetical protein